MNVKAPEGLFDKLKMLPQLGALTSAFPKTVSAKDAPCKEVILRDKLRPQRISRFSSAGRTTAAASSRCPACTRATRAPASATSACTACRSTTARPPACTGSGRRLPPSTIAKRCAPQLHRHRRCRSAERRAWLRWPSQPAARSPFPTAPSAACRRSRWAI